jgi:polyisoprenoid-binding protein YceI
VPSRRPLRWLRWIVAGVAAVAVLAVGGTYVYIHFIEGPAPAPLSLKVTNGDASASPGQPSQAARTGSLSGAWRVTTGSVAGYRVKEVLLGQNNIAVGRTSHIKGDLTIKGNTVTAAAFTVAMATIHSDQSQRDAQFDGRIMDVTTYPTGTFILTRPISLVPVPAAGRSRPTRPSASSRCTAIPGRSRSPSRRNGPAARSRSPVRSRSRSRITASATPASAAS